MINKISFTGKVYYMANTPVTSRSYPNGKKERKALKKYADENNCDIAVLARRYNPGGSGTYKTIITEYDDKIKYSAAEFNFENGEISRHSIKLGDIGI